MERRRIYIWLIIILLATNVATIGSIIYHVQSEKKAEVEKVQMPAEQRTRFLVEQLDLNAEQQDQFRSLNRTFNRTANPITRELNYLRLEMLEILGEESPDKDELDSIAKEVGALHTELKEATISFYLGMKALCDDNQNEKLYQIFHSMLNQEEDVKLPRGRHGGGRNGHGNNNNNN